MRGHPGLPRTSRLLLPTTRDPQYSGEEESHEATNEPKYLSVPGELRIVCGPLALGCDQGSTLQDGYEMTAELRARLDLPNTLWCSFGHNAHGSMRTAPLLGTAVAARP